MHHDHIAQTFKPVVNATVSGVARLTSETMRDCQGDGGQIGRRVDYRGGGYGDRHCVVMVVVVEDESILVGI